MATLKEKTQELHARREELFRLTKNPGIITAAQSEEVRRRNQEIKSLCDEVTRLRDMEHIAADNVKAMQQAAKSLPLSTLLTTRELACIELRIPRTGDKDLDALIAEAQRRDLAAMAMQGILANLQDARWTADNEGHIIAAAAAYQADALITALNAATEAPDAS